MSLQNIQAELVEMILANTGQTETFTPSKHIMIYRNNMRAVLNQTLSDCYPMIMKLLGNDFFNQLAKEYINSYPSRSGNLHDYGEYFSDFLKEHTSLKNLPYLKEVSQFEWICHSLYVASDANSLDLKRFQTIPSEQYHNLHFLLHPASFLLKCYYPLLRIIQLCKGEINEQIDLNEGGMHLLILRRDEEISLITLSFAEFNFLNALNEGLTIEKSLETALLINADFTLDDKLSAWIQNKILVDFY